MAARSRSASTCGSNLQPATIGTLGLRLLMNYANTGKSQAQENTLISDSFPGCSAQAKQTNCLLLSLGGVDRVRNPDSDTACSSGSQIKTPQVAANCQTGRQLPTIYLGPSSFLDPPPSCPFPASSFCIYFACLIFRPAHNV